MNAYLDNSATTQPCPQAISAAQEAMTQLFYNPSAAYAQALPVLKRMDAVRADAMKALGARDGQVIFTSGGTESDHMAIEGAMLRRGAKFCAASAVEHPAVRENIERFEHERIPVDAFCGIDLDRFESFVKAHPELSLLSIMQVNNETGAVMPVEEMARMVKTHTQALVHVDGVQGFLHQMPLCFKDIDLYTFSGHKIHALKGIGGLWIKNGVRLAPTTFGGGQEGGLRNGTENTPGIFALGAAIEAHDLETDLVKMRELKMHLYEGLMDLSSKVLVNGPAPEKAVPHILNVSFDGVLAEVLLHALEGDGICVSTGSACAARQSHPSPVLTAMGLPKERIRSAIRFSLSRFSTREEIDYTLDCLKKHLFVLSKFKRR